MREPHFYWRGMPPMHQREAVPLAKIGAHLLIQRVIVEQLIQLAQHPIDALGHARHPAKHVFGFVAIHQHARASLLLCLLP
jgi:hypothetical protein